MAEQREPFKYSPLDKTKRQIRVITVLPKLSKDGLIQCHQHVIELPATIGDEPGPFRALSYEWGDEDAERFSILMNDATFTVRANLHAFLLVYRKQQGKLIPCQLPIWIDAMCINQTDTSERNHQVSMMKAIYSYASEVVIWLGMKLKPRSHSALRYIRRCSRSEAFGSRYLEPASFKMRPCKASLISSFRIPEKFRPGAQYMIRSQQLDHWINTLLAWMFLSARGIRELRETTYVTRAWVQQEIILARERVVFLGSSILSWAELKALETICLSLVTWQTPTGYHMYPDGFNSQMMLYAPLISLSRTSARIPHDHVYAFLGLCSDGAEFPVNYDSSLLELVVETSLFCVSEFLPHHRMGGDIWSSIPKALDCLVSNLPDRGLLRPHWASTERLYLSSPDFCTITHKHRDEILSGKALYNHFKIETREAVASFLSKGCPHDSLSNILTYDQHRDIPHQQQRRLLWYFFDSLVILGASHIAVREPQLENKKRARTARVDALVLCARDCQSGFMILAQLSVEFLVDDSVNLDIRFDDDGGTADAVYGMARSEYYGSRGLPGMLAEVSPNHWSVNPGLVFPATDIRPVCMLTGLPTNQAVRKAALDLLYADPDCTDLRPNSVHFERGLLHPGPQLCNPDLGGYRQRLWVCPHVATHRSRSPQNDHGASDDTGKKNDHGPVKPHSQSEDADRMPAPPAVISAYRDCPFIIDLAANESFQSYVEAVRRHYGLPLASDDTHRAAWVEQMETFPWLLPTSGLGGQ